MADIEGRDIFVSDFIRQELENREHVAPSEIQKFFDGATIFITGGTGFFGKILIEKLLRVCKNLERIYMLMRPKKGKSLKERFDEQFEDLLFEPLKKIHPNFREKITIITGDLAEDIPIFLEEDRQKIIQTVNIVFHCAATVRFDEKLRRAVSINIKSTKYLLDLAHEMKNLKAFTHVSTAYSNCPEKEIGEVFYPPPYNYKKIISILDALDDTVLDKITPELLGKFPNTYAFTKMIAESVVKEYGKGLPIGVLRPSIVISTHREPISGWINNFYGPQGVVFGAALGLLRTMHCDSNVVADMVPVDLVINSLIALAWDVGQTKGDNPNFEKVSWKDSLDNNSNLKKTETEEEIPILNYVSSERNPITWGAFMDYNYKEGTKLYSCLQVWHSNLRLHSNYYGDRINRIFYHYLPALIVDLMLIILQKKPMLWNAYKKIHKFSNVISYFCTSQWKFKDDNVVKMWNKLSPKDKELFHFNIQDLSWEEYFTFYIKGMRVYLAKDSLSTLEMGKKRAMRLKIYHYTLVTIVYSLLVYMLYRIFFSLFI